MFVQCTGTQVSQFAVQAARLVRLVQPEKSPAPPPRISDRPRGETGEKSDENEINEQRDDLKCDRGVSF